MNKKKVAINTLDQFKEGIKPYTFIVCQAEGLRIANNLDMYCGKENGFGTRLSRQLYSGDRVETTYTPLEEIVAHQKNNITGIIDEAIDFIKYNGLYKEKGVSVLDEVDKIKNLWWLVAGAFGLGVTVGSWLDLKKFLTTVIEKI